MHQDQQENQRNNQCEYDHQVCLVTPTELPDQSKHNSQRTNNKQNKQINTICVSSDMITSI